MYLIRINPVNLILRFHETHRLFLPGQIVRQLPSLQHYHITPHQLFALILNRLVEPCVHLFCHLACTSGSEPQCIEIKWNQIHCRFPAWRAENVGAEKRAGSVVGALARIAELSDLAVQALDDGDLGLCQTYFDEIGRVAASQIPCHKPHPFFRLKPNYFFQEYSR